MSRTTTTFLSHYRSLRLLPSRIVTHLEQLPTPLVNYLLTFGAIITLRNFLEGFSHNSSVNLFYANLPTHFLNSEFIHFALFYLVIASLITLLLHLLTKTSIPHIIKVVVPTFSLILLPPLIDILLSGGRGQHISYLFPNENHALAYYYFTFFHTAPHISLGIKLELLGGLGATYCYLWSKGTNLWLTLVGLLMFYSAIFLIGATPYILTLLSNLLPLDPALNSKTAITYLLLLLFPLAILLGYYTNKKIFRALIADIRWLRLLHFQLMLLLGVALAAKQLTVFLRGDLILLSISIWCFWLFALMSNNISDQEIDRISNPIRPLIAQTIALKPYRNISYLCLWGSLSYALAVNLVSFLIMNGVALAATLYSLPPLRLKRVPILAKAITAIVSLALVGLGYLTIHGNWSGFPTSLSWIFLLGFTLAANFIDIKDYAGDKANQIMTLPVLLHPDRAKILIGLAFIATNLSLYFYLEKSYLVPLLLGVGILEFYLLTKKEYQEWPVLSVYLVTIIFLIIYILLQNLCP